LKKLLVLPTLAVIFATLAASPSFGVNRETLQMMQQLDQLQQAVSNLQRTVDTQTAVLKTLVEQSLDSVNKMQTSMDELKKTTQQNLAASNARLDSMTGQIQALNESLEEAKARISKVNDQLSQLQNIMQTLPAQNPAPGQGPAAQPAQNTPAGPPEADVLYQAAYNDYTTGQYQLSLSEFQQYLQYYGKSDKAGNAQFYIGDCYYHQGNYKQAVEEYNKCLERYPDNNKQPSAQLKKGYALLELDERTAGIKELRSLIQHYPDTNEADLARQRLRKLGVTVPRQR
jgi:tol-pal system protein YbgF